MKILLFAPLLLIAACGDNAPTPAASASPTESGYIARVQALTAKEREGVLFRAIQSGGGNRQCFEVRQVETMPPAKDGRPIWRVTCNRGVQFAVVLGDDGTALVTGARDPG